MELFYFLGRFHVLFLHLPIGIICAAIVLEFLARKPSFRDLKFAANYLWAAAAVSAVVTVILGLMHFSEGGFTGDSVTLHRNYGILVAISCVLILVIRSLREDAYTRIQSPVAIVMLFLITMTGHYGGNITHGQTYLLEYAPKAIQRLAGFEVRDPVEDIAEADIFLDVVHPMLQLRCGNCHNSDKQRGELSIASYELFLEGGETGPAFVPGDPESSEMYRRITLSPSHEDHMPADGKTPLRDEQIELVGWWLEQGAPAGGLFVDLSPSKDEMDTALTYLNLNTVESTKLQITAISDNLVEAARAQGYVIRAVSQDSALLDIDLSVSGGVLSDDRINALNPLAEYVATLNLRGVKVEDSQFSKIELMPHLIRLNVSNTAITDASLEHIAKLPSLNALILFDTNKVTEASLATLDTSNIQRIYSGRSTGPD